MCADEVDHLQVHKQERKTCLAFDFPGYGHPRLSSADVRERFRLGSTAIDKFFTKMALVDRPPKFLMSAPLQVHKQERKTCLAFNFPGCGHPCLSSTDVQGKFHRKLF